MICLASPYTHPDPAVREARFQAACRQAAANRRWAGKHAGGTAICTCGLRPIVVCSCLKDALP